MKIISNPFTSLLLSVLLFSLAGCDNPADKQVSFSFPAPPDTAELFAPGIVSTFMNERDFSMNPAMDECYFTINEGNAYAIVRIKKTTEGWTQPAIVSFNSAYNDIEPFISVDGQQLFFASDRPVDGRKQGFDIWVTKRTSDGWGPPQNLGAPVNSEKNEFYPSVAANGNLYFTNYKDEIMKAVAVEGRYDAPIKLSDSVNSGVSEYNAFIAPDESYLLFSSHGWPQQSGSGDIFISEHHDGTWSTPRCLDERVNAAAIDFCPYVSPDGRYLFFSSRRKRGDQPAVRRYDDFRKISASPQNGKLDIYVVSTDVLQQ